MANFMYVLRPTEKKFRVVCPACAKRGMILDICPTCHGNGYQCKRVTQYYVQDRPIEIEKVDRDPKKGILRYWENMSEFFYETTTPELNPNVPEVPYGVHLCHDNKKSAQVECDRINSFLNDSPKYYKEFNTGFHF